MPKHEPAPESIHVCGRDLPVTDIIKVHELEGIVYVVTTSAGVLSLHPERDKELIATMKKYAKSP